MKTSRRFFRKFQQHAKKENWPDWVIGVSMDTDLMVFDENGFYTIKERYID